MRFGARGEPAGLRVPHVDPLQAFTGADDIRDSVQRVAGHSINALNTRFHEYTEQPSSPLFSLPLFGSSLPTGSKVEIARTSLPSEMGTVSDGASRVARECECLRCHHSTAHDRSCWAE